jgi:alpha-ketoglutarate-dependent taurine dioxygenase
MSVEIIPTNAVLGEIRGIDLARPLDEATFCEIERAFHTHPVIFFRDQRITPPQQVAFTRRLVRSNSTSSARARPPNRRPSRRRELA